MTIILGVDPGLHKTGLGLISWEDGKYTYITHSIIKTQPYHALDYRLNVIFEQMSLFISIHKPDIMIVEEIFASINKNTIIKLGMARAMPVLCAARFNCELHNIPTRVVKKIVTGKGNADKTEVAIKVCQMLNLEEIKSQDATDALACALYYCRKT